MYKVKAVGPRGPIVHACGTADQAYDLTVDLSRRGFSEIVVTDLAGKVWDAAAFQRSCDVET